VDLNDELMSLISKYDFDSSTAIFVLQFLNHPVHFEYAKQALGGFIRNGVADAYISSVMLDEAVNGV
jgi:hypothetical protein